MSNKLKNICLTLLSPGGGAHWTPPPYAFLITAPKRMLRSTRNFLTFPKYQKQKKSKNFSFIFLTLAPQGGFVQKIGKWKLSRRE